MKSVFNSLYPDQSKGKDVYLQGSRQMDSLTRQYYERNLGAGMFVSPETENGLVGYSEPLRRFIQHEGFTPQVNEIQNTMPSWIPGEDHLINFQKGDPYTKVDEGYARLPDAGYAGVIYTWSLPPANIKISPRAPGRAPPHPQLLSAAPRLSPPASRSPSQSATFRTHLLSERAMGQATLSVFPVSVPKQPPLFLFPWSSPPWPQGPGGSSKIVIFPPQSSCTDLCITSPKMACFGHSTGTYMTKYAPNPPNGPGLV
jgi:hypothetical protein